MITLTLAEVAEIVGGQLNGDPHIRVDSVEFDSRKVTPHTLFVALRGARVDGHDFATSVDGPVLAARPVDAPSVVVPHIDNPQSNADAYAHDPSGDNASVLEALSKLARYNIDHADVTVIGVTGSAGKTSTKDLIASVVQRLGSTVAPRDPSIMNWGTPTPRCVATRQPTTWWRSFLHAALGMWPTWRRSPHPPSGWCSTLARRTSGSSVVGR